MNYVIYSSFVMLLCRQYLSLSFHDAFLFVEAAVAVVVIVVGGLITELLRT